MSLEPLPENVPLSLLREQAEKKDPLAQRDLLLNSSFFNGKLVNEAEALQLSNRVYNEQANSLILKAPQQDCLILACYALGTVALSKQEYDQAQKFLRIAACTPAHSVYTKEIAANAAFTLFEYYQKNDRNPPRKVVSASAVTWLIRALILGSQKAEKVLEENAIIPELNSADFASYQPKYRKKLNAVAMFTALAFFTYGDRGKVKNFLEKNTPLDPLAQELPQTLIEKIIKNFKSISKLTRKKNEGGFAIEKKTDYEEMFSRFIVEQDDLFVEVGLKGNPSIEKDGIEKKSTLPIETVNKEKDDLDKDVHKKNVNIGKTVTKKSIFTQRKFTQANLPLEEILHECAYLLAQNPEDLIDILLYCHNFNILPSSFCIAVLKQASPIIGKHVKEYGSHLQKIDIHLLDANVGFNYVDHFDQYDNHTKINNFFDSIDRFPEADRNKLYLSFLNKLTAHLFARIQQLTQDKNYDWQEKFSLFHRENRVTSDKYILVSQFIFDSKLTPAQKHIVEQYTIIYNRLLKAKFDPAKEWEKPVTYFTHSLTRLSELIPIIPQDELLTATKNLLAKQAPDPIPNEPLFDLIESTVKLLTKDYLNEREQRQKNSPYVLFSHHLDQILTGRTTFIIQKTDNFKKKWEGIRALSHLPREEMAAEFMADLTVLREHFPLAKSPTLHPLIQHQMAKVQKFCAAENNNQAANANRLTM